MLHIAPDNLQSTLGLKLPPVFTFLPCLASRPGLLPGGQGGCHARQGDHGPKYQLIYIEQLGGAPLEFVESSDYIGNKVQENSGRQIMREIKGGQLGEKVGEKSGEKMEEKTGEKVGESLGEIHKLNLCQHSCHYNNIRHQHH